jgi:hypothetical protein
MDGVFPANRDQAGAGRDRWLDQAQAALHFVATVETSLYSRAKNLMKAGLTEERAWRSACNQRGPWWNSGASHMNQAFPKSFFDRLGLVSLLDTMRRLQCVQ